MALLASLKRDFGAKVAYRMADPTQGSARRREESSSAAGPTTGGGSFLPSFSVRATTWGGKSRSRYGGRQHALAPLSVGGSDSRGDGGQVRWPLSAEDYAGGSRLALASACGLLQCTALESSTAGSASAVGLPALRPLLVLAGIFLQLRPLLVMAGIFLDLRPLLVMAGTFLDLRPLLVVAEIFRIPAGDIPSLRYAVPGTYPWQGAAHLPSGGRMLARPFPFPAAPGQSTASPSRQDTDTAARSSAGNIADQAGRDAGHLRLGAGSSAAGLTAPRQLGENIFPIFNLPGIVSPEARNSDITSGVASGGMGLILRGLGELAGLWGSGLSRGSLPSAAWLGNTGSFEGSRQLSEVTGTSSSAGPAADTGSSSREKDGTAPGSGSGIDAPGPDPMLVWIMGHSYVVWAALRAAVRPDGRQLGLSRETVTLRWIGFCQNQKQKKITQETENVNSNVVLQ
ncbi:unnamed protein product [Ranitomeya imitator]|uniref:Uncharacterized protein n=1 Tax=Ranitomeya imitator TaxID=111125 RepID=A0ABN9M9W3_9NEOB|nr:unnamed protein product [Ranitomeya imitator]